VKAALSNKQLGLINKWLRNIKDTYRLHRDEIEALDDDEARVDRLVELNVREQVVNLAKTSIVQLSWKRRQLPILHGWVYGLKDGILKQLAMMGPEDHLDPIYRYELDALE
jgi:carbonic anhydrase